MLNKMLIFFFSIDSLLLLLPLQAVQWKYYRIKKESIDSRILFYTVSAEIFELHGFLFILLSLLSINYFFIDKPYMADTFFTETLST